MSKRFTETELWEEDWYIALPKDYKMFWMFLKDSCDHAGIWKPNITKFNKLYDCEVDTDKALMLFNATKERVRVLKNSRWFMVGFIPFQYGRALNLTSRTHTSIYKLLIDNEVDMTSIRPLVEVIDTPRALGVKDKDKDKVKDKDSVVSLERVKSFNSPVKELQDFFYAEYQRTFGDSYVAAFGKDGAIFKDLLKTQTPERIRTLISSFFACQDEFMLKAGYTVGVFKSQINKLSVTKREGVPTEWLTKK